VRRGTILSLLFSISIELIICLYLKKGISDTGIRTLFIRKIKKRISFTLNGRYQNNVGAKNIISNP
jgi:hypothetical protein